MLTFFLHELNFELRGELEAEKMAAAGLNLEREMKYPPKYFINCGLLKTLF
jgi:hypothetical protein